MAKEQIQRGRALPILKEVRACEHCAEHLPLGPKPLVAARSSAKILVVGQAPGRVAHETGKPWNDKSGERLRQWMGITDEQFYDDSITAIMPMGFCFPGTGKSGDMPPRPECAPLWHERIKKSLNHIELTVYAGRYAIDYYSTKEHASVTAAAADYKNQLPDHIFLPHPSPRNNLWLRKNAWFEEQTVPLLQKRVAELVRR